MRHMWWPFRTYFGAPTRGKEQPQNFEIKRITITKRHDGGRIDYDKHSVESVSPRDYPLYYLAYKFPTPGVFIGRSPTANVRYEAVVLPLLDSFEKVKGTADGIRLGPLDPTSFARLLAKIAHGYAVAEVGRDAFRPVLCRFIRKGRNIPFTYIGGEMTSPPPTPVLHELDLSTEIVGGVSYLVVSLRLFSFFRTPRYYIVVGTLCNPALDVQSTHVVRVRTRLKLAGEAEEIRG